MNSYASHTYRGVIPMMQVGHLSKLLICRLFSGTNYQFQNLMFIQNLINKRKD